MAKPLHGNNQPRRSQPTTQPSPGGPTAPSSTAGNSSAANSSAGNADLLGVFADQQAVADVVRLVRALGVDPSSIRVETEPVGSGKGVESHGQDHVAALRSEMREEMDRSLMAPQAGLMMTKRSVKGVLAVSPVAMVIGALVTVPFAFIPGWGPLSLGARILVAALVGVAAGATVGFIVGAGEAEKGATDRLASEHGSTVRVSGATAAIEEIMKSANPLRLDLVAADGTPIRSLYSRAEDAQGGVVEDLRRAWREPDR
ncbi:MAG: hypothetical protein ACT4OS_05475 [Acidimicrobiales bacterium]